MVLPAPGHLFENQKDSKGISLDLRHIITIRLLKPCHAERPCTSRSLISTSTPISCDPATLPKNHNGRNGPSISLSNKKSSDCVIPHQSKGFAMKIYENYKCIWSEHPPQLWPSNPKPWYFTRREAQHWPQSLNCDVSCWHIRTILLKSLHVFVGEMQFCINVR